VSLGPTHFRWRADVQEVVLKIHRNFPNVRCNTYEGHPWPGWDGRSIDVWGLGGRGDPIPAHTGHAVKQFLRDLRGAPFIRHHIYLHELWTSFGGYSTWISNDHSLSLRHLHVTYW
jgi:hypothetical protein